MRVAAEPDRLWLRLDVDRGRVLIDKADPPVEQLAQPAQPIRALLSDQILDSMNSSAMRLAEIAKAVDRQPKDGSVRNALAALVDDGSLVRDGTSYRKVQKVQTEPIAPLHLAPDEVQSANTLNGDCTLHPPDADAEERIASKFDDGNDS